MFSGKSCFETRNRKSPPRRARLRRACAERAWRARSARRVAGSFRRMDRPEAGGVVDELHQEVVLLRVAVIDEETRKDPASGLEPAPRFPAPDPPPPRDPLPSVRVAPEEFDDADQPRSAWLSPSCFMRTSLPQMLVPVTRRLDERGDRCEDFLRLVAIRLSSKPDSVGIRVMPLLSTGSRTRETHGDTFCECSP